MKITVPMLVLAVGLATGARALAQTETRITDNNRSTTVLSDGSSEVRVESDGSTARVSLNGKLVATLDMNSGWTEHKVVDAQGNVIATLRRSGPGSSTITATMGDKASPAPTRLRATGSWRDRSGQWQGRLAELMEDEDVQAAMDKAREKFEVALAKVERTMPKVMIGVTMTESTTQTVNGQPVDPDTTVMIQSVITDGPAAKAGIEAGDVIIAFGDAGAGDAETIRKVLRQHEPGDVIDVELVRNGVKQDVKITLEKYSPSAFGITNWTFDESNPWIERFLLSDEEMAHIQAEIAELAEQLGEMSSELATAVGARAQELGKISAELSQQIAKKAAQLARRSAAELSAELGYFLDQNNRAPLVFPAPNGSGSGQGIVIVPSPPTAPKAPTVDVFGTPAAAPNAAEMRAMDERIRRIEEMLQQLLENQQSKSGGNR